MPKNFLASFSLGPVQAYIEQARSVRDLWTGSYLISWLTARAAAEAINRGADFADPQWEASALVRFHLKGRDGIDEELLRRSSLPNAFMFRLETTPEEAQSICDAVESAVHAEWKRIAGDVCGRLRGHKALPDGWDEGWMSQLEDYWRVGVEWLEVGPSLRDAAKALGCADDVLLKDEDRLAADLLGRAAAAGKMLRPLRKNGLPGDTRPKCSLSGEEAQMGPRDFSESARFWAAPDGAMSQAVAGSGEKLRQGERLGAPALVKRLAWACSIAPRLKQAPEQLRTTDTATIAAGPWIMQARSADPPVPDAHAYLHEWAREKGGWSGQWIHREDDEEPIPQAIGDMIAASRRTVGPPPVYYAVVAMDGDRMGERLRACNEAQRRAFTEKLSDFSLNLVPGLVRGYLGGNDGLGFNQPIYAGGDDVLALLPMWMPLGDTTESVLALAKRIARRFGELDLPGGNTPATMSAGVALVHYKADLRQALEAARAAEKEAKKGGRDRLCLSVVRRSGEHADASSSWDHVGLLEELVRAFLREDASDRWAYSLRQIMDALVYPAGGDQPPHNGFVDLMDREAARLIAHGDKSRGHTDLFQRAWDTFSGRQDAQGRTNTARTVNDQRNALTLIQSASFMARGREEA